MSEELKQRIYTELSEVQLIDSHTRINPRVPAAKNMFDILGDHHFTALVHSAGLHRSMLDANELSAKEKIGALFTSFHNIDNTVQFSWFIEMVQDLFGFNEPRIDSSNWESLYDKTERLMQSDNWTETVMKTCNLEAALVNNAFDDPLTGFDTNVFIPCLQADDLVFHLNKKEIQDRFNNVVTIQLHDSRSLWHGIAQLFEKFCSRGARTCAVSLPADFALMKISNARADTAIRAFLSEGDSVSVQNERAMANFVLWSLAELCDEYELPLKLMIGAEHHAIATNAKQDSSNNGPDSLVQYSELFHDFPNVKFPVSIPTQSTKQELANYASIFPNVYAHGHGYSSTPVHLELETILRLEVAPRNKQIGYFSGMHKLEFALPKFNMYKRVLTSVLAERFVIARRWSEEQAVALGKQNLRGNIDSVFLGNDPEPGMLLATRSIGV